MPHVVVVLATAPDDLEHCAGDVGRAGRWSFFAPAPCPSGFEIYCDHWFAILIAAQAYKTSRRIFRQAYAFDVFAHCRSEKAVATYDRYVKAAPAEKLV